MMIVVVEAVLRTAKEVGHEKRKQHFTRIVRRSYG
jgi:hypothetical protein